MIVTEGTRCRVLWGSTLCLGKVAKVFTAPNEFGIPRTRYQIHLDNGRCVTTTIDAILEP
jgi:hypothetical protein